MPQAVIDVLEAVQIEQCQRAGQDGNAGGQALMEGISVGKGSWRGDVGKVFEPVWAECRSVMSRSSAPNMGLPASDHIENDRSTGTSWPSA